MRAVPHVSSSVVRAIACGGGAALAISHLAGCAALVGDAAYSKAFRVQIEDASNLSQEDLEVVRATPTISAAGAQRGTVRGQVKGLACKLSIAPLIPVWIWNPKLSAANGNTPEEAAMMQLKLAVRRVGANALSAPNCMHKDGIDWGNNCFDSWTCSGEAVLLAPEDAAIN